MLHWRHFLTYCLCERKGSINLNGIAVASSRKSALTEAGMNLHRQKQKDSALVYQCDEMRWRVYIVSSLCALLIFLIRFETEFEEDCSEGVQS